MKVKTYSNRLYRMSGTAFFLKNGYTYLNSADILWNPMNDMMSGIWDGCYKRTGVGDICFSEYSYQMIGLNYYFTK